MSWQASKGRGVLVVMSVKNGVRPLLNYSISHFQIQACGLHDKKCGLNNIHVLKNKIPAPTMGPHSGECGKSVDIGMAQSAAT